ncbi:MAG TPA: response regulator [Rhizobacter sp.]|nr:response regulator [Rhizobacter sp.]
MARRMTATHERADVLIVDDNELNLEMAAFLLGADGLKVATAQDADAALVQLATHRPRLVLMDIQMPRIDGLELTRRLRADPAHAGLVVVAFTAYAMKGDEARMLAAGCDGYIAKPIDVGSFAASVRRYLT